MKNNSLFQIAVLALFGFFAVVAVFFFSLQKNSSEVTAQIQVWGTEDQAFMNSLLGEFAENQIAKITYVQKPASSFNQELVEAIAEGRGPDVIILDHRDILRHKAKISLFPFDSLSERDFRDAFLDGADVFWTPEGYIGLPFSIDPLVMYWNKSLFLNEGVIRPPSYWDEFATLAIKITKKDQSFTIEDSFVALGEYSNIENAKGIISILILQAGSPIISYDENGVLRNYLNLQNREGLRPADVAFRFYTEFADPSKSTYSWNRSLPSSQRMFTAGDLALYFGFASEVEAIRNANPNLNFDVAIVPQIRNTVEKMTYGNFKAVAVLKSSQNISAAYGVARLFASSNAMEFLALNSALPPVGKKVIENKPLDPYKVVFYDSALIARAWLDPDKSLTDTLFSDTVGDITSGRLRLNESVNRASDRLESLLR